MLRNRPVGSRYMPAAVIDHRSHQADQGHTIGLRWIDHDLPDAPRTWVMDVDAMNAVLPDIPVRKQEGPVGFWNNMPLEEQREPVQWAPPSYRQGKEDIRAPGFNVKEMVVSIAIVYIFMGLMLLVGHFGH